MKKQVKPRDPNRKLTKKERVTLEPLYITYKPVTHLTEEEKAKARREIQELF